jgi:excisionase family DNA binding protein
MERKYLSIPEVAEILGISSSAAWQRLYRGQLPYRRWGKRVLVPLADLERFLAGLPGRSPQEAVATMGGKSNGGE